MLLPALASAKRRALNIKCVSNEKQIALAMILYAGDYQDKLPYDQNTWYRYIVPYMSSKSTNGTGVQTLPQYMCPQLFANYPTYDPVNNPNVIPEGLGYGVNQHLCRPSDTSTLLTGTGRKLTSCNRSTIATLVGDRYFDSIKANGDLSGQWAIECRNLAQIWNQWPGVIGYGPTLKNPLHSGLANCAMVDGHVAGFKLNVITNLCSASGHGGAAANGNGNIYDLTQ
jgi:prepilin-type processing-associated H-X9-DG protein